MPFPIAARLALPWAAVRGRGVALNNGQREFAAELLAPQKHPDEPVSGERARGKVGGR